MATKSTTKPKSEKRFAYIKQHKLLLVFAILLSVGIGMFSYQKYLDARNVSDMKQMLGAFEELKATIESETDQEVEIEANCGSVGKFATSYACTLNLTSDKDINKYTIKSIKIPNFPDTIQCGLHSEIGYKISEDKLEGFGCRALLIRKNNKEKSESIFYQYDISPGRPI